jgi:hypothetical protein
MSEPIIRRYPRWGDASDTDYRHLPEDTAVEETSAVHAAPAPMDWQPNWSPGDAGDDGD